MKLLIGGSPCTHWSIAKTRGRETEPEGLGWELFKNYLIAREKFKPEYFLYENNYSMSAAIREQITAELGVEPIMINSALVSAQSRKRLYWTNIPDVRQPEDRGLVLRDILETALPLREKGFTLKANYGGKGLFARQCVDGGHFPANGAAEPVDVVESGESVFPTAIGYRNRREADGKLYRLLPEYWERLKGLQRRTCRPMKGKGKSVFDLETRFKLEDERAAAGLSTRNKEFFRELAERLKTGKG